MTAASSNPPGPTGALRRDSELVLAPGLRITLRGGKLHVEHLPPGSVVGGAATVGGTPVSHWDLEDLPLLSAFRHPIRLDEALEALDEDPAEWMRRSAQVLRMLDAGVLVHCDGEGPLPFPIDDEASWLHIAMLSDTSRTSTYLDAVRHVVRPGDVVVDLGSGTGILAIAAAQAGARHVYAIEKGAIADQAARLITENGLDDRITLIRDLSTRVELPEKANVLVTETFGNEPLGEQVLAYVGDAVRRLLTPDARLVPSELRIMARLVQLQEPILAGHIFHPAQLQAWSATYGIELAPLADLTLMSPRALMLRPDEARKHQALSDTVELCRIDLAKAPARIDVTTEAIATAAGRVDGALVVFELRLSDAHMLTTDPVRPTSATHWRVPMWLQPTRPVVAKGEGVEVRYLFDGGRGRVEIGG